MASSSTASGSGNFTANPMFQLTRKEFEQHEVWQAYKGYLRAFDSQDRNFDNFYQLCLRFGYVPSLDTINWIIRESNLIDTSRRLQFPVYAFMQEFQFVMHVAHDTNQPRILIAHVHTDEGPCPIWAGWSALDEEEPSDAEESSKPKKKKKKKAVAKKDSETQNDSVAQKKSKAKMKLYLQPYTDESGPGEANIPEEYRAAFKWEEPFEVLFNMGKYEANHKNAVIQNTILLGVAKVLTRFPGLVKPPPGQENSGPWLMMRAAFSNRPFDIRELPSAVSPWWGGHDTLISGPNTYAENHANHPPGSQGWKRYLVMKAEKKVEDAKKKVENAKLKLEDAKKKAEEAEQKA
ncbi:hypothetical protein KCU91_g1655, partial [Aureobasidium melanogenum]